MTDLTAARELEAWLRNDGLENVNGQWIRSRVSMQKYLAALSTLIAECEWQPIETAPKCVMSGPYDNGRRPVIVTRMCSSQIPPVSIARLTARGWLCGEHKNKLWFEPTHWRPLPDPPQPVPVGGEK